MNKDIQILKQSIRSDLIQEKQKEWNWFLKTLRFKIDQPIPNRLKTLNH